MAVPAGFDFGRSFGGGVDAGRAVREGFQNRNDRKKEMTSRSAAADATLGAQGIPSPQDTSAHASFLSNLATGVKHMAQGIEGYFNPQGATPAAAPPPAGALPVPQQPVPGGAMPPPMGMPAGAAAPAGIPLPDAPQAQAAAIPPPGGATMMATGGIVPDLAAGVQAGQAVQAGMQANQQRGLDASANQAAAQAIPTPQGATAPNGQYMPPGFEPFKVTQVPRTHRDEVDDFATHLHDHSLNDAGVPHGQQGIASSPADVLAQVAQNPAAAQGIPEASPSASAGADSRGGTAHSLTPQFWEDSDMRIAKATKAAALAGHDPQQVFNSLNSVRTSFVQGHVLRNLSSANVALMNGDSAAVEKALRNVNYYLPDGQDLKVSKTNGQLMYQNPIHPFLDEQGAPTDVATKTKNMIPVDASHIQMLGQAMLDPMKVNDLITGARSAAAKAALENAKAGAAITTANAAATTAGAANTKAQTDRMKAASGIYKDTSQGSLNESKAKYYNGLVDLKIKAAGAAGDKLAYTAGNDAAKAVYALSQGQLSTVPIADPQGNPSLSPAAGKSMRDPSKIPPEFQLTPEQTHNVAALAGEIGAANRGKIPAEQAAQIAAQVYGGVKKTHPGPDGKPQGNVKIAQDRQTGWYWNGASWTPFRMSAETGGILASGSTDILPPDKEEGEQSSSDEEPSDDDNTPAE